VAVSKQAFDKPQPRLEMTVKPTQTSVVLRNLSAFTRYHISVLAFTIIGDGKKSQIIVAGEYIYMKILSMIIDNFPTTPAQAVHVRNETRLYITRRL
jgi:hypothetical protein